MKRFTFKIVLSLFVIGLAYGQTPASVRVQVEKHRKISRVVKQKAGNYWDNIPKIAGETQNVSFTILVQPGAGPSDTNLLVKYAIFGKENRGKAVAIGMRGQKKVGTRSMKGFLVETEQAQFVSEDTTYHGDGSIKDNKYTGTLYYGVAVSVYSGKTLVGEYVEPPGLEEHLAKLNTGL